MDTQPKYDLMPVANTTPAAAPALQAGASPFKVVVDPVMRELLLDALFDLIDHHDKSLAGFVAQGHLALDSYKEYIELFARSLRETMESTEGILYLLRSAGVEGVEAEDVNLHPDWRWK